MGAFVPVAGAVVAQKFQLERPLARGGMGTVWAACHLELQTPVAVKFMEAPETLRNARARFEREARALATLRDPHIVQVLDYGVDRDTPYLVMELLEGEDLSARLDRLGKLSLEEVTNIVRQVAMGLELAHEAGVIHRDIKLSNVFLARVGSREIAKILDFGVAKGPALAGNGEHTTSCELIGSPAYMSPEQARGAPIDHLSDLWSLAVVAFVALTGKHPFAGENLGDVLVRICTEPIEPATSARSDLPPAIDGFFARALCRSPDGRFPSAAALADALAAVARGDHAAPMVRDEPTVDIAPVDDRSLPTTTHSERPPAPKTRAWAYVLAGGAAVGLVWLGTQSLRGEAAAPVEEAPAPAPPPATANAPARSAVVSAAPSVSASSAPPPVRRWRPAPRPSTSVDPKFGLPQ